MTPEVHGVVMSANCQFSQLYASFLWIDIGPCPHNTFKNIPFMIRDVNNFNKIKEKYFTICLEFAAPDYLVA